MDSTDLQTNITGTMPHPYSDTQLQGAACVRGFLMMSLKE